MSQVTISGSDSFIGEVERGLQLLSATSLYESHFLQVIRRVHEVKRLRHAAVVRLSRGRGTIVIRSSLELSKQDMCLVLAHEAFHNVIYHQYVASYGLWRAWFKYWRDIIAIERQCVEHELSVAHELGFPKDPIVHRQVLLGLIPHKFMLEEQARVVRRLRRKLHPI